MTTKNCPACRKARKTCESHYFLKNHIIRKDDYEKLHKIFCGSSAIRKVIELGREEDKRVSPKRLCSSLKVEFLLKIALCYSLKVEFLIHKMTIENCPACKKARKTCEPHCFLKNHVTGEDDYEKLRKIFSGPSDIRKVIEPCREENKRVSP
ncbi:hypothetical protein HAX54_052971, partial [Datura stramonium]|nr:hypothetical protein [Datura stramonium]